MNVRTTSTPCVEPPESPRANFGILRRFEDQVRIRFFRSPAAQCHFPNVHLLPNVSVLVGSYNHAFAEWKESQGAARGRGPTGPALPSSSPPLPPRRRTRCRPGPAHNRPGGRRGRGQRTRSEPEARCRSPVVASRCPVLPPRATVLRGQGQLPYPPSGPAFGPAAPPAAAARPHVPEPDNSSPPMTGVGKVIRQPPSCWFIIATASRPQEQRQRTRRRSPPPPRRRQQAGGCNPGPVRSDPARPGGGPPGSEAGRPAAGHPAGCPGDSDRRGGRRRRRPPLPSRLAAGDWAAGPEVEAPALPTRSSAQPKSSQQSAASLIRRVVVLPGAVGVPKSDLDPHWNPDKSLVLKTALSE